MGPLRELERTLRREMPGVEVVVNAERPPPGAFELHLEDKTRIWSKLNGQGFPQPEDVVRALKSEL